MSHVHIMLYAPVRHRASLKYQVFFLIAKEPRQNRADFSTQKRKDADQRHPIRLPERGSIF